VGEMKNSVGKLVFPLKITVGKSGARENGASHYLDV